MTPKTGPRLAQGDRDILAYPAQPVCETYRRRGLALARGGRGYGGDKNQLSVFPLRIREQGQIYFRLVVSVLLDVLFVNMGALCDNADVLGFAALRNFNVG